MSVKLVWIPVLFAGLACTVSGLGNSVTIEQFPSVVQIENRIGFIWLQQCVGSIITNYHILSAASCFTTNLNIRRVRAGSSNRGVNGIVKEVLTVHEHPSFGRFGKDGDIAVIRLESALPLGTTMAIAELLGDGIYVPESLPVIIVSWGATAGGTGFSNSNLNSLVLYVKYDNDCYNKYHPSDPITENMICAGLQDAAGSEFDARDVGAPIYYQRTTVAIVAFGVSSDVNDFPVVSTSVASYTNWIIERSS